MDIIQYTQEHRIFRDAVKKFLAREVIPYIEEWEEAGIVPRDVWKKMGAQGYLGMSVPEDYGGPAADFLYEVIVIEELARTNFTGLAARLHNTVVLPYLIEYGSEEQKCRYLPGCISGDIITAIGMTEPNTGSDLAAIRTTAGSLATRTMRSQLIPLLMKVFCPLITNSSPSSTAVVRMAARSLPVLGSVMPRAVMISPEMQPGR